MCGGGQRQEPATIVMPDYDRYDRQFEDRKDAIVAGMQGKTQLMQLELDKVLRKKNDLLDKISEQEVSKAKNQEALEEKATRLALLMGPPPPEEVASAPEVGVQDRDLKTRKGKKSLRIRSTSAKSSAKGTGLNIT